MTGPDKAILDREKTVAIATGFNAFVQIRRVESIEKENCASMPGIIIPRDGFIRRQPKKASEMREDWIIKTVVRALRMKG